jgi:hypothetical protein
VTEAERIPPPEADADLGPAGPGRLPGRPGAALLGVQLLLDVGAGLADGGREGAVEESASAGGRMMSGRRVVPGSKSLARAISGARPSSRRTTRDGPYTRRAASTMATTTTTGSNGPPAANLSTASEAASANGPSPRPPEVVEPPQQRQVLQGVGRPGEQDPAQTPADDPPRPRPVQEQRT